LISDAVDVAVVGAGPYGLSLAAHLRRANRSVRIFGDPMAFWIRHMPPGMRLKSEGFASDLYDPRGDFTLRRYCAERRLDYADIGLPVAVGTFAAYGLEFQRRYVPGLEPTRVDHIGRDGSGFDLRLTGGERLRARKVVVATGVASFAYTPAMLASLSPEWVTHSVDHGDVSAFSGRRVAVLGAGASAADIAVALRAAGATVELLIRGDAIRFHDAPAEPRPWFSRLIAPRSGLGIGWRSRFCTDLPVVFHLLPRRLRFRAVARHLGPAPCWFVREAVDGHIPVHLRVGLSAAVVHDGTLRLSYRQDDEAERTREFDHVVAATGFRVAIARLNFLGTELTSEMRLVEDTPVLDRHFQSSIPGLYFTGGAAANSFGPMLRFAFGARFAARRISAHLAAS